MKCRCSATYNVRGGRVGGERLLGDLHVVGAAVLGADADVLLSTGRDIRIPDHDGAEADLDLTVARDAARRRIGVAQRSQVEHGTVHLAQR